MSNIRELWVDRATMNVSEKDILRKVLDPSDTVGIKNVYIDIYLKHYLLKALQCDRSDAVLDIGCGYGRLTNFIAPKVKEAIGVDITEAFIKYANTTNSQSNAKYLLTSEFHTKDFAINKAFMVWVGLCFEEDIELTDILRSYLQNGVKDFILIDQIKERSEKQTLNGAFYAKYRTIDDIITILSNIGFKLESYIIMGERNTNGLIAKLLFNRYVYKFLPAKLSTISKYFFFIDHFLKEIFYLTKLCRSKNPLDICFHFTKVK